MFVLTADEMRRIDFDTIERVGIPALVLMENAGRAVAEEIAELSETVGRRWLILAGKGNNGADGLVAARHLQDAGLTVTVLYADDPALLRNEAAVQRNIASRIGLTYSQYNGNTINWKDYDGIVDALLGTGSKGKPREAYANLIGLANDSGRPIVAIDIPSGLDADTGEAGEPCVRAMRTVALGFKKRGLLQYPGAAHAGDVTVRKIGIPPGLAEQHGVRTYEVDKEVLKSHIGIDPSMERAADTHKGTYGHVLVAAGSKAMSGAGLLSATAALRGGCGLVSWAVPESLVPSLMSRQPELMLAGVADEGCGDWTKADPRELLSLAQGKQALVIGPGMGRWEGDGAWLRAIWEGTEIPLVIDADALNMIADADDFASWAVRQAPTVLTPHPGEMARLADLSTRDVQRDRIEAARGYAVKHGVTVVLKGARTVCAAAEGEVYINVTGNAGMATGGAGDVLAGVIGSLLAQGLTGRQAAVLGVYWHGEAGDRAAARRQAPGSLIAGDIIAEL
ncbi:NAD(P)H-hydrate dehydratase [Paenibacillus mendelii]|uniref:Bifunctional NAD(P)H-hydrate repair enzyme n=1 Tax=Paenibacillus mendelii TaxID=206163 RepID=A0ABV6J655_9BACL|nr:NAD(P)H-hydrate dehydratase [Paenibacillus mendelii]MCQ6560050.1 NAD(P)H-hydrate dehydratase [Paenibacillus mendelii]